MFGIVIIVILSEFVVKTTILNYILCYTAIKGVEYGKN